jgi:hypothetical protein
VKVYVEKGWVYTNLSRGFLLCIGTVKELHGKNEVEVARAAMEAFATAAFHNIKSSKGFVLH